MTPVNQSVLPLRLLSLHLVTSIELIERANPHRCMR